MTANEETITVIDYLTSIVKTLENLAIVYREESLPNNVTTIMMQTFNH